MRLKIFQTGLIVGTLFGLCHLLWSILVATTLAQKLLDFILKLHFLNSPFQVQAFNIGTAALLVVITFAVGFVVGMVLAFLCNLIHKK